MDACIRYSKLEGFEAKPTLFFEFHGTEAGVRLSRRRRCRRSPTSTAAAHSNGRRKPEDRTRLWKARHAAYYAAKALSPGKQSSSRPMRACRSRGSPIACSRPSADAEATGLGRADRRSRRRRQLPLGVAVRSRDAGRAREGRGAGASAISLRAIAMGGTCTGEHGIGMHKLEALAAEHGEAGRPDAHDQARARSAQHHEPGQDRFRADLDYGCTPCTQLYLGNKNYSSWSLRGCLCDEALRRAVLPSAWCRCRGTGEPNPGNRVVFADGSRALSHDGATRRLGFAGDRRVSGRAASRHVAGDPATRAWARSVAAEMHSGFSTLRNEMTMCIRERVDVRPWSPGARTRLSRA